MRWTNRKTGDKPAVLSGVFPELIELVMKLSLLRVTSQAGKDGRIDLIGCIVQGREA